MCRQVIYANLVLPCDEVKGEVRFFSLIRVELSKRRRSVDRFRISKELLDSGARIDPIFAPQVKPLIQNNFADFAESDLEDGKTGEYYVAPAL